MTTLKVNLTENEIQEQPETDDLVTLVKKTVCYDEMLITRKEFNELNKRLKAPMNGTNKLYAYQIGDEYKNQIISEDKEGMQKWLDARPGDRISDGWYHFSEMDDYAYEAHPPKYAAFSGDVTSYTDDAIAFMYSTSWSDGFNKSIREAKLEKKYEGM